MNGPHEVEIPWFRLGGLQETTKQLVKPPQVGVLQPEPRSLARELHGQPEGVPWVNLGPED